MSKNFKIRRYLVLIACIGIVFDTSMLSDIMQLPPSVIHPQLVSAISSGYITAGAAIIPFNQEPSISNHNDRFHLNQQFQENSFQNSNASTISYSASSNFRTSATVGSELEEFIWKSFRFCNESLYENIRKCIDPQEFKEISLAIARRLNGRREASLHNENCLVDVVRHYNACLDIVTAKEEILTIAQLNVTLGLRYAKDFASTAVQYFEDAEELFCRVGCTSQGMIQTKLYLAKFYLLGNDSSSKVSQIVECLENVDTCSPALQCQINLLKMCLAVEKREYHAALSIFTQLNLSTDIKFKVLFQECPTSKSLLIHFTDLIKNPAENLIVLDSQSREFIFDALIIAGRICMKLKDETRACYFKLLVIHFD